MNMDATIILEKPKLSKYIDEMKENIADTLSCSKDILSIKATTSEGIGFVGRQEGIACLCSILLDK
jgi:2-C-methyl-D-erythritol 2,4-cyclodiphosphate synthase